MATVVPSGILKKATTDRQYSYEDTVLGRYRLEMGETEEERRPKIGFDESAGKAEEGQEDPRRDQRKKSVRFRELERAGRKEEEEEDEEEGEEEERVEERRKRGRRGKRRGGGPKHLLEWAKQWARETRRGLSWKSVRLMLIDWLFLAILGIGMALTSMFMDNVIEYLQTFQLVLISVSGETGNPFMDFICSYLSWLGYTELLVISSAIFVHYIAPQAVGSGIPEMKTILRGVILKDYLTARTLFSKVVGLTFALGSGIPIGKMGPFVHVAANAANLLSNLAARFEGAYGNECRKSEMLAAACATGVACTFSAPIGGVLFSIEVTTMYFSVRNYWRGFFAAACGAIVFRWLRVVAFSSEVTLVAFYQTHFPEDSFEAEELPFFALIGLFCGFIGTGFIFFYRNLVMFLRQNKFAKRHIQKNWLLYPVLIAFLVATLTYPRGYGRFLSGRYKFTRTVLDFFSNCTWSKGLHHPVLSPHGCSSELLGTWTNHEGYGPYNVFLVLTLFTVTFFFLSALCNTMPIPCGMFMPLFVVGAAFGRLMGEVVATIFPDGIPGGTDQPIFPGIYAVVGAAALTGAVTHSVSVAMICCEITGQLIYIIPLMLAVIIANAVCAYLQPSVYDVMIGIKNLPYLPDIPPSNAEVHQCTAENIMVSNVRHLCRLTQYKEIHKLLVEMPKLRSFPVVDDPALMMLLGSISRRAMLGLLNVQIGDGSRKREAERRIRLAIETIDKHFREAQLDMTMPSGKEDSEKDEADEERGMKGTVGKVKSRRCALSETGIAQNSLQKTESRKRHKSNNNKQKAREEEGQARKANSDNSSRFHVEPVVGTPKRRCVSSAYPPVAMRNRRNAVSSMVVQQEGGNREDEKSEELNMKKASCPAELNYLNSLDHQSSISRNLSEYVRTAKKRLRLVQTRKDKESEERVNYDLTGEERREWELAQLECPLELEEKLIDPAPFQLVRRTSVYKVHYLFSLLDLERAYVTDRGRLVGVVALRDLRIAIQNAQNGIPICRQNAETNSSDEATRQEGLVGKSDLEDIEKGQRLANGALRTADVQVISESGGEVVEGARQQQQNNNDRSADSVVSHFSLLEMIREDEGSRSPSVRSRYVSAEGDPQDQQAAEGPQRRDVVQAVAYLRRKSIALEDLKPLETTPLPTPVADEENIT